MKNANALALPLLILTQRTAESSRNLYFPLGPSLLPVNCTVPQTREPLLHTVGLTSSSAQLALQARSSWGWRSEVKSEGVPKVERAQGPLCWLLWGTGSPSQRQREVIVSREHTNYLSALCEMPASLKGTLSN